MIYEYIKNMHDIAMFVPNLSREKEHEKSILSFILDDLGTLIQIFSSNDVVIFVHDVVVDFFSWAWTTELELTKF